MSVPSHPAYSQTPTLASAALPARVRALLEGILEYASEEIERALSDTLNEFEQQLFKFAEQARSPATQSRWLEAQRMVKRTRPDVIPHFMAALEAELASIRSTLALRGVLPPLAQGSLELSLIEEREMDEASALTEIANRAEVQNSLPLYLLGQRFGVLAGKPAFDAETLPIGPQALSRMMKQAITCLELGTEHRLLLYRTFERQLAPFYTSFIEAINASLAQHGVLPHLQYVPVRIRPYASTTPRLTEESPNKPVERIGPGRSSDTVAPLNKRDGAPDASLNKPATDNRTAGILDATAQDSFQLMRQLLAGRRQLLGKLGKARQPLTHNTQAVPTSSVLSTLGALQKRPVSTIAASGKVAQLNIGHLKQDLLITLRNQAPEETSPTLTEEDNDTIDLVGMLFDHLLKDVQPKSPAAQLLSKLQAPLLRVALQDKSFFTRKTHPARQMINAIAETGAHWLDDSESDPTLIGPMQSLVDRTIHEFDGDVGLFTTLLEDLSSHLQTVARKADVAEKRQIEAARGKEKLALARQSAANVINDLLKNQNLPRFTHALLSQAWTDVLALTALRQGEDTDAWRQQLEIAKRLVRVAKAKPEQAVLSADEAKTLCLDIQSALAQVGYHEQEARAISQCLINPHETGTGDDDRASRTELTVRLKARARLGSEKGELKARPQHLSTDAASRMEQIMHLPFGTWFEFTVDPNDKKIRRRMSWFSTVTGHVLLVNHRGQKSGEHTLESLAIALAKGQARIVEEEKETLIDRAWNTVIGALRSFAGQKPASEARP